MSVKYERAVVEDLNTGTGKTWVTLPGGGTAVGTKVNLAAIAEASGITLPVLATGAGATVDDVIEALQALGLVTQE